jgi:hypothetical protein
MLQTRSLLGGLQHAAHQLQTSTSLLGELQCVADKVLMSRECADQTPVEKTAAYGSPAAEPIPVR